MPLNKVLRSKDMSAGHSGQASNMGKIMWFLVSVLTVHFLNCRQRPICTICKIAESWQQPMQTDWLQNLRDWCKISLSWLPPWRIGLPTSSRRAGSQGKVRAALHLEAGPIPLEADCMKFQPFLGWRRASTTHYNKIITWADFSICKGLRVKKLGRFNQFSIIQQI
jgi:hypothetical protein